MNTPEPIDYNAEIEQLLLDRIYLIDQINHFGLGNSEDERPAFVLLGTPAELIAAISALLVSARKQGASEKPKPQEEVGGKQVDNSVEQYKCQSYYSDDGQLRDCTCGKCELGFNDEGYTGSQEVI